MSRELPDRPSLEQYRKQAKELVAAHRAGDRHALQRIRQHHPRFAKLPDSELPAARFVLADAQCVIAREHGFASWPKFAKAIEARALETSPAAVWAAEKAVIAGDAPALERLLREHAELFRDRRPPSYTPAGPGPQYVDAGARAIIAREQHFESWDQFAEHQKALRRRNSPVARFEAAVEAVIAGDSPTLERLLREHPELIRARSPRRHRATLLHYVGANGVEGFRQKTPPNAVEVARILLEAHAEIDAVAEMYGGSTTLGLVATSIHPLRAGVQNALIDLLLAHGAAIDDPRSAGNGHNAVNGCLANGRREAAEFLASRGAALDVEGAAGVGRLELVRSFFDENGSLKATATANQMRSGFNWACEYGRTEVVDFLLRRGIDPGERHRGETGLHWAAYGGHGAIVRLLLDRGAPVDVKDERFDQTPLGWALYGWAEPGREARDRYYDVVARLVGAGATVEPAWLARENVGADPRMLAALRNGSSDG